jgi:hypothetical protein
MGINVPFHLISSRSHKHGSEEYATEHVFLGSSMSNCTDPHLTGVTSTTTILLKSDLRQIQPNINLVEIKVMSMTINCKHESGTLSQCPFIFNRTPGTCEHPKLFVIIIRIKVIKNEYELQNLIAQTQTIMKYNSLRLRT